MKLYSTLILKYESFLRFTNFFRFMASFFAFFHVPFAIVRRLKYIQYYEMSILKIRLALSKTSLDSEQRRSLRGTLVVVHGGSFVPFAVGSLRYSGYEKLGQDPCTSRSSREGIGRLALIERPYIYIYPRDFERRPLKSRKYRYEISHWYDFWFWPLKLAVQETRW